MSNLGGGGDPARSNGPGRGRGGGFNSAGRGGGFNGTGNGASFNGPPANNGARGGGGYNNRFFGGGNNWQSNFVAGESSGSADNRDGHGQAFPTEFGSDFGQFNRGSNYNNYNRNGGNLQYRPRNFGSNNFNANNRNYNGGRSNYNQYRNSGGGNNGPVNQIDTNLAGISPDLLKEAMQGVVAALAAAAQKGGGEGLAHAVDAERALAAVQKAGNVGFASQQHQMENSGPQQVQPMQLDTTMAPKPDAPNPTKKVKKTEKNPCFWCKKPGHQIDTCTAPVCDILTVTQLGHDGIEDIGGNNGGDDDNGANGDNGDDANDMDIEKTANNENQNNGNKRNGNIQQGKNGKGVVSHQAQEQVKAPILFASLNNDLLSKDMDITGTSSQIDSAPGLVKIWPEYTLGSVQPLPAVSTLLLGSQSPLGASRLAEPAPGALSPLPWVPLSPRSPGRAQQSRLVETATLPLAGMATAGTRVAPAARDHAPVPHLLSPLTQTMAGPGAAAGQSVPLLSSLHEPLLSSLAPTVAGPTTVAGQSVCMQMDRAATAFGSSATNDSVIMPTPSNKKIGTSVVFDTENSSTPAVVTRQFSGTVKGLEGAAKKTPSVHEAAIFGGIASPSLSNIRTSERIRAQPNADATQMERAIQNVNLKHDYATSGNEKASPSFALMLDKDIIFKASRLGISLGKNDKEITKDIKSIKDVDVGTTLVL
ncbi:hypothetical protein ACQ4PT_034244 [Festuca glaucescens]